MRSSVRQGTSKPVDGVNYPTFGYSYPVEQSFQNELLDTKKFEALKKEGIVLKLLTNGIYPIKPLPPSRIIPPNH
ncbi:hypothetical protein ID47_00855 [Candidatus Paracaedibacter acanthamoebae]|uniref:Uncharacterized protein n=1 Tax=Candidatus Odyssella acanthamoebae TaxID=91604 RepID=A0A077AVE2_9PROT|nr:hypothetical protein ID47_00855 [Candidatus Paracaedibacter acanthamoebae]